MTPHPARLAAFFDPPLPVDIASQLLSHPRFASRIAALLGARDTIVDKSDLDELALRAGMIFHAPYFVREIRGPAVAELATRFGAEHIAEARLNADLGADFGAHRPSPQDIEDLAQAIERDGSACIGAWIASLPEEERRLVALQWADDSAVPTTEDAEILSLGPKILNRLMES